MRTHVDTSAKAGMLYAATPQRTWCQRCTTTALSRRRPTYPPPSSCLTGRNERESRRRERQRHTPGRSQGKSACQREGRAEERVKSDEATKETRGSQQLSKGRAQERGHGRHTAHGGHHSAPKHRRGEHQRDKRKVAPRPTTRNAQTPHTPHTPTPAPTWPASPGSPPRGQAAGKRGRLNPEAPRQPRGAQTPTGRAGHGVDAGPPSRHTRAHSTWVADPDSPPRGRAAWGGGAPDHRRPSQRRTAPPPGDALPPLPQRATPARKGARCGAGAGSPRPHRPHPGHTGRGTLAARLRGRAAGGGTVPDTRRPSQRWQATPPGDGPPPAPRHATPAGHAGQGDSVGPPHPRARAHSTWVADPNSPPSGRAVGGGGAPDHRRPSQRWKAAPPGDALPPPLQRATPARKGARCGAGAGSHARTDCTRDTRVGEPWLPAPEDGRPGEGQRLTQDPPHNGGRPPPPGTAPHQLRGTQPPQGMQARGTVLGPHTHTPVPTARGWRTPTARPVGGQSGEGERLTTDAPHNGGRHPTWGRPSATPLACNGGPQGRTLWGRCWVPTPAPTAPGTHGSRNPGCPPQRTGGRGRDSA